MTKKNRDLKRNDDVCVSLVVVVGRLTESGLQTFQAPSAPASTVFTLDVNDTIVSRLVVQRWDAVAL